MNRRTFSLSAIAAALTATAISSRAADVFGADNTAIKIIVPFAPGGSADIVARLIGPALSAHLNRPVIVENRPGAGGSIGTNEIAKSKPDGLTLGIATVSGMATAPASSKVAYNVLKDFTAITNLATTPNLIAVHPSFPAKNFKEFLAVVRKNPGKFSYATSGIGSVGHLQMLLLSEAAGLSLVHVPYSGAGPALAGVISGQGPEIIFDQLPSVKTQVFAGKLRAIVTAAEHRLPTPLDMPTLSEEGFVQANRSAFYGLVGPAGMPKPVSERLRTALTTMLITDFTLRNQLSDRGMDVDVVNGERFAEMLKNEFELYQKLVQKTGLKVS